MQREKPPITVDSAFRDVEKTTALQKFVLKNLVSSGKCDARRKKEIEIGFGNGVFKKTLELFVVYVRKFGENFFLFSLEKRADCVRESHFFSVQRVFGFRLQFWN